MQGARLVRLPITAARAAPGARIVPAASFASEDASTKGVLAVSDIGTNAVDVFDAGGALVAQIAGLSLPQGLAGGAAGVLYVANTGASDVLEYGPDHHTLEATLTDPNQYPAGVGIDVATGVVGVTNIFDVNGNAGSVSMYAPGTTTPCVTVGNPNWAEVYYGAFSHSGRFYVDGVDANGNTLTGVVSGECAATSIVTLAHTNTIAFPGGVSIAPNGKILVLDQVNLQIFEYAVPIRSSLGAPLLTIPLSGATDPVTFSLTAGKADLWTADVRPMAAEYAFPAGGAPAATLTSGLQVPIGALALPAQHP